MDLDLRWAESSSGGVCCQGPECINKPELPMPSLTWDLHHAPSGFDPGVLFELRPRILVLAWSTWASMCPALFLDRSSLLTRLVHWPWTCLITWDLSLDHKLVTGPATATRSALLAWFGYNGTVSMLLRWWSCLYCCHLWLLTCLYLQSKPTLPTSSHFLFSSDYISKIWEGWIQA